MASTAEAVPVASFSQEDADKDVPEKKDPKPKDAESPPARAEKEKPAPSSSSPGGAKQDAGKDAKQPPAVVEFEPPLACIRRILKQALPASTNVGKDASAAFSRACGIFIIYVTACANDCAREGKRQTITANDVIAAMKELDFEDFVPEMRSFLEAYRANEKSKRDKKAAAKAAKTSAVVKQAKAEPTGSKDDDDEEEDEEEEEVEEDCKDDTTSQKRTGVCENTSFVQREEATREAETSKRPRQDEAEESVAKKLKQAEAETEQ